MVYLNYICKKVDFEKCMKKYPVGKELSNAEQWQSQYENQYY